jgi:ubiquitin C-terminal hydrolase
MTKQVNIEPSEAICIQFKRFNKHEKLDYRVPILTEWNGYDLVGICNHIGCMSGGHYTAVVRTDTGWKHINDEFVKQIDGLPKSSKMPYVMVYVRHI